MTQTNIENLEINEAKKTKSPQKHVLIFCSNGYVFNEIYRPLIEELSDECTFDVLLADYYLPVYTQRLFEDLIFSKKINSYQIVQPDVKQEIAYSYHKRLRSFVQSLCWKKVELLVIGAEFETFDRYLVHRAIKHQIPVAIVQTGTLIYILNEFEKKQKSPDQIKTVDQEINPIKAIIKFLIRIWRVNIYQQSQKLMKYNFFPFNFEGGFFCYSEKEKEAIRTIVPRIKNVFVVRHPSTVDTCRCCQSYSAQKDNKLLVAFGGCLDAEMKEERFDLWVAAIRNLITLADLKEIHLRFHPRTSPHLRWPERLSKAIKMLGCAVKKVNSLELPLEKYICDYTVMFGSPSGALRVARACCQKIIVIGLPNCCDGGPDDQKLILGNTQGIHWLENTEQLCKVDFSIAEIKKDKRPSLGQAMKDACFGKNFIKQ